MVQVEVHPHSLVLPNAEAPCFPPDHRPGVLPPCILTHVGFIGELPSTHSLSGYTLAPEKIVSEFPAGFPFILQSSRGGTTWLHVSISLHEACELGQVQGLWCRSAFAVRQGGGAASSVSLSETSPRLSTRAVAQPLPALADVEVIVTARLATCFVLLRVILLCRVPALSMLYMNTAVLCESLPGWGWG